MAGGYEPDELVPLQERAPPEGDQDQPGAEPADLKRVDRRGGDEQNRKQKRVDELGRQRARQPLRPGDRGRAPGLPERRGEQHRRREQNEQQAHDGRQQQLYADVEEEQGRPGEPDRDEDEQREPRERPAGLLEADLARVLVDVGGDARRE